MQSIAIATIRAPILTLALAIGTAACSGGANDASATPAKADSPAVAMTEPSAPASTPSTPPAAEPAAVNWDGTYTYEFGGGANAAGTDMVVTYTLALTGSSCRLTAEGYQTDETIVCTSKPSADGIDIAFKSYGDGRLTDRYDNAVYSVGDPLFSLQRKGTTVLTHWKGYPLPDEKPHPIGVYFRP